MSGVEKKLAELGYRRARDGTNLTDAQVLQAIRNSGLTLPGDYVEFLRAHPHSGYFDSNPDEFDREVRSPGPPSRWADDGLYPVDSITGLDEEQGPLFLPSWALPGHYLPIASSYGDSCVVMDLRQSTLGRVLFLIEGEFEEAKLVLLADSFSAFVLGLKFVDNEMAPPKKPSWFQRIIDHLSN